MTTRGWARANAIYDKVTALAAVLLVVFWITPASAQTAQSVAALLDGVSIPDLDGLPISNLKVTETYKSADVTVRGLAATVLVFTRPGTTKPLVSVMIGKLSPADIIPGAENTPLKDVEFHSMSFLYNTTGKTISVDDGGYPKPVSDYLSNAGPGALIKPGLNIYGRMIVTPEGEVADLLSNVGITDLSLPLKGKFSPAIFKTGQSLTAIKNEILDNLDINLPLPTLTIPGLPNAVTLTKSQLAITSTNDSGTRTIEVDVAGEMDVAAAGKTANFDYTVDVVKQAGKAADFTINGSSAPGSTLSVNLVETFSVSNLVFSASNNIGKWTWQISGDTDFRKKTVSVDYMSNGQLTINEHMSLADIAGHPELPVLSDIRSNWIIILPKLVRVDMNIKGVRAGLDMWKPQGSSKYITGFTLGDFSPTKFIPGSDNTPLKDATFKGLVFINKPTDGSKTYASFQDLPDEVGYNMRRIKGPIVLKKGLNVFGHLDIKPSGEMASLLKEVGVTDVKLPLSGTFSPKALAKNHSTASIKTEIINNLDLNFALPAISIPGVPNAVNISKTDLTIKGKDGAIDVAFKGDLDITHGSTNADFKFDLDITKRPGKKSLILFTADEVPGSSLSVLMLERVTLTNMSFNMDNDKPAGWTTQIKADSTINKNPINLTLDKVPGSGYTATITTAGLTIAHLIDSPGLPGLDDVTLDTIEMMPGRLSLHGTVKGVASIMEIQKTPSGKGHFIAVYLNNLSPANLIPGMANTPLKDVDFTNLVALYSPAGQATTLANSGLSGNASPWIKKSNSNPTIKPGMNLFGHMDITPSGEMATLLKKVGVSSVKIPINGGISKSTLGNFSAASIKSEVLNALDVKIKLPALKIPDVDKFVTFSSGSLTIKGKTPKGAEGIYLEFAGDAVFSGHGTIEVDIDYDRTTGGGSNFWVEAKGPINMGDIPGVNDIPNASHFSLTDLKVSKHGIEAATTLNSKAMDVAIFDADGWNAALTQSDFSITEVIPGISHTPLKHISFPQATVVISKSGISKRLGDLSPIAQDAFKAMFPNPGDDVQIISGLSFMAGFHPDNAGAMKDAVKGIGIHTGINLMGEIGGLFGGSPMVKLQGTLSNAGAAGNMPSSMKYKNTEQLVFFLTVLESGQDFDFELGIGVDIAAKISGDDLTFQGKTKIQVMEEGFGIDVEASMIGDWDTPFDIPFSISNVTIEVGTQEDGAIKMGFKGTTDINGDTYSMAGDGEFLPEALGAPQAIAFKASASEIDMFFLEEVAFSMAAKASGKAGIHLPISKIPQPKIKNAMFAFATPGAEDPDLGIVSEGFALGGQFYFLGKELGAIKAAVGPTSGISITGSLDNFDLGPLTLKNNNVDIKVPFTKVPSFKINADLEFLGVKDRFEIIADAKTLTIKVNDKFGPDFIADFDLKLRGVDLNSGKYDKKTADFYVKGVFEAKIADFVKTSATTATNDIFNELNSAFADGEDAVKAAKKVVNGWKKKLNAERAKVRREKAAAEAKVTDAENRVNSLNGSLNHAWHKYHHCHGWGKYACKIKWGIEIGGLKGSIKIADGVLDEVRSAIKHFPIDLDPRVAALIIGEHGAMLVLDIALDAIKGLDVLDKFLKEATAEIEKEIGKSININKVAFEGDLRGVIEHDTPVDLTLDAEFFGATLNEKFAFKLKDLAWDGEQLGLMGLYALEHVLDDALKDLPSALKRKVRHAIGRKIDASSASRNRALAAAATSFSAERKLAVVSTFKDETAGATQKAILYNQHAAQLKAQYAAETKTYIKKVMAEEKFNPLDHQGPSLAYTEDYFEVGHSGLCLTVENGGIVQHPCKGDKAAEQKWTTKAVLENGKDSGYVHFTQNNQCASPDGKWVNVTEKFGDEFTFTAKNFQGTGKLSMGGCYNDKVYDWKILKHGTDWVRMVNRATNHCIHFENSNAVPGKAKAIWGPCMGTANQVYRVADKLTPIYHKAGFALRNDFNSLCLGDGKPDVSMVTCDNSARYDYLVDVRGFIKFLNTKTGKCLQPKDYTLGTALTEKTCSQLDYQWWKIIHVPGGWSVQNAQTKHCDRVGGEAGDPATQDACTSWSQAILVPLIDAASGVNFQSVKGIDFPTGGVSFNINLSLAQRKSNYDQWFHVKWQKEAKKIHREFQSKDQTLSNELYTESYHKECGPQFDPAIIAYNTKYKNYFDWKKNESWGQECIPFVPPVTTHLACPPTEPPEYIKTCRNTYKDFGWTKNQYAMELKYSSQSEMDEEMGCTTKFNDDWASWHNKHSNIYWKMKQGQTCGPAGTAVNVTGGEHYTNTCPPPAPTSTKTFCGMTWGYLSPGLKKEMKANVKKLYATWQKDYNMEHENPEPPAEAPQYLCRALDQKSNSAGYSYKNLMIGIVKNRKCVYASDYEAWRILFYKGQWDFAKTTDDYEVLMDGSSVKWEYANGKIPQRALALGYRSSVYRNAGSNTPLQSTYACRVLRKDATSVVGWTMHGADCTYVDAGKVKTSLGSYWYDTEEYSEANKVQILVRDVGKVVQLNLAENP